MGDPKDITTAKKHKNIDLDYDTLKRYSESGVTRSKKQDKEDISICAV